jgi:aminocarboxymuconate-semialdehyde decarboxylase
MSGVVEVHAHVIPDGLLGAAGPHGPEIDEKELILRAGGNVLHAKTVGHKRFEDGDPSGDDPAEWWEQLSSPTRRLREMDAKGVESMIVSPAPPLYLYHIEPEYAVPFARAYNNALARYCATAPDRLHFMATVPLQVIDESVLEVKRAVNELDARGIYIGTTDLAGRELDHPELWPLYEAVVSADLPLAVHPGLSLFTVPVDCYHERLSVGFAAQETHAIFRLIAGGVFDAFPELKVYVSHGGGFFPFQMGRIQTFLEIAEDSKAAKPVAEYLRQLYFDIILHDLRARQLLVDVAGPDRLLLGSNFGVGMDSVDGVAFLEELKLPDGDRLQIARSNAYELFKLGK